MSGRDWILAQASNSVIYISEIKQDWPTNTKTLIYSPENTWGPHFFNVLKKGVLDNAHYEKNLEDTKKHTQKDDH